MKKTKIFGIRQKLRLSVYRSNKHIYAQLIDDEKGETLVACSDIELKIKKGDAKEKLKKIEIAKKVGQTLATRALKKKIKKVVLDRGEQKYHGIVKALAEGAREKGLNF